MSCEYCEIKEGKREAEIIYQDDELIMAVKDHGLIPGQIVVFPKQHFTIMEMVPDELLQKCSIMANKVSIASFEALAAEGTNMIIKNGTGGGQTVSHFGIEIIPRRSGDGINLEWPAKELSEADKDITAEHIRNALAKQDKPKEIVKEAEFKEIKTKNKDNKEKNYLLKSIERMP